MDRIGKKNSLVIGNILYSLSIFAMIFMRDYYELLFIQFIYALGYTIKGICESNILYDSLPIGRKRGKIFSKIDGQSTSNFYFFDAVSSIIAGLSFAINGYLPMILCFICCIISTMMSFRFRHTTIIENKVEVITIKEYSKQIKEAVKFAIKSRRARSLFLFNAILLGVIYGIVNLRSSMLSEMQVPEQYFGIIFAILQLSAGFFARKADNIQNNFKNKTLTYLGIPVTVSCIIIGFIGKETLSKSSLILVVLMFLIQYSIKGPYLVLITRYLNNFTNKNIRPKITALKNLSYNLCSAIISLLCGMLLAITTTANTFIIIGCITTIGIVLLLDYMRDKVGLKPEQYKKEDLSYWKH